MTPYPRLACAALALAACTAQAASVWRCGPDGNRYSDAPCGDGRLVQVDDARSAERVAEARAQVQRERALALALAAERRQREADGQRQGAASLGGPATVSLRASDQAPKRPKARKPPRRPAGAGTWPSADRATPRAPD